MNPTFGNIKPIKMKIMRFNNILFQEIQVCLLYFCYSYFYNRNNKCTG